MAFVQAVIIALALQATLASATGVETPKGADGERTIFIDGGETSTPGDLVDVFLYFGTFTLAVLTALAIIGLIYGVSDTTATGYGATAGLGDDLDSYSAYEKIYNVARSLYDGYQKYEAARSAE